MPKQSKAKRDDDKPAKLQLIIFNNILYDCNDYCYSISKVIWGFLRQIHRKTSNMQHIVALYYRINVYFYLEDDGAECMLSRIILCSRWK